MSWTLTLDGPVWEHIAGQWYEGDGQVLLCDSCAAAWSEDNADFEFDSYEIGYVQTGGQLRKVDTLPGDVCIQCERKAGDAKPDSATAYTQATASGLKVLALAVALLASALAPACRPNFAMSMRQRHCILRSETEQGQLAFIYNFATGQSIPYTRQVLTQCYECPGGVTRCGQP